MTESRTLLRRLAALESPQNQQGNLERTIDRLVNAMVVSPEGEARKKLLDEIRALSAIVAGNEKGMPTAKDPRVAILAVPFDAVPL